MAIPKSLLYSICFLDIVSIALVLPVAPMHIISIGGSRFLIGLMASMHALLQLLSGPLIGSWSDTKGRKTLLLHSLLLCIISNLLLTFTSSLFLYILSRIIFGVSCHVQILVRALIADSVPKNDQNGVFAKMGAIIGLSFIVGPVLGGIIGNFLHIALILSMFSIINLGLVACLPDEEAKSQSEKNKKNLFQELGGAFLNLRSIKWDIFWDVFLFKFLLESCFSALFSTFGIILMEEFGASQQQMALVISLHSSTAVFANLTNDKIKRSYFIGDVKGYERNLVGFVGATVMMTLLYLGDSFWTYVFVMVPLAFARTILDTTWTEMLISRTTDADKGTIMGSFESVFQMAGLATPLITGFVGDSWGYSASLLINVVPVATGSLIAYYCFKKNALDKKKD